ncbi:MAG: PQQ-binding-like beta-propeller repeat protein, partial [Blastocatellia bacterium]
MKNLQVVFRILFRYLLLLGCLLPGGVFAQNDWPNVGNDKGAMRYSTLRQINRDNVKNLKVAWTYHTGDTDFEKKTPIQCTPIVINGVMYLTTAKSKVVALDAATGREIWKYDPYADYAPAKIYHAGGGVNRGVAYWSAGAPRLASGGSALRAAGNKIERILMATSDGRLLSLDARTGKPDPAFGRNGAVDLREG